MSSCCIPKASVFDAVCLPKCHVFTVEELKDDEFVCWRRPWWSWWLAVRLKGEGNAQRGTATCGVVLCGSRRLAAHHGAYTERIQLSSENILFSRLTKFNESTGRSSNHSLAPLRPGTTTSTDGWNGASSAAGIFTYMFILLYLINPYNHIWTNMTMISS